MVIYGTPTTAGTYLLSFTLKTFITLSPASVQTDVINYYKIVINTPIGLNENTSSKFELMNLYPNPSNSTATIRFSSPKSSVVKLSVYNTLGKAVMIKTIDSKQGENDFNLNVKDLSSGIYICSLESEGKTLTKKLIVSKD
ncbi:MAG: T9SS type A sorting domain-containing protein [Bacteroidetes bacterium]|nr:T9SS type A sorting domain-containing protein [Bacteroidota bacterium]